MSNRLTFSLASLIFLIALGLVFVPTAVMAHDLDTGTEGLQHAATGGTTLTDAEHRALHLPAPAVESIELVDIEVNGESTIRDGSVELVADLTAATPALADGDTTAGNFLVKITFSEPLYTPDGTGGPSATLHPLAAADLTITAAAQSASSANLVGVADATAAVVPTAPSADNPTTSDTEDNTGRVFYVSVAVGQTLFGGQTGDAEDGVPIDVWVQVNAGVGVSATQLVRGTTTIGSPNTVLRQKFTVVEELPMAADTTAPTAMIKASAPDATTGNVMFTITFDKEVTGFSLGDLEVENGSAVDFGGSGMVYTLEVTPDAGKKVTVSFADDAMVTDTATPANALDVAMAMSGSYEPEGYSPTIGITVAAGMGDDEGKVIFTLNFSETPDEGDVMVSNLEVTGGQLLKNADLAKADMPTEGYVETWTLTVTPASGATEVMLTIRASAIGNFDSAQASHTITATDDDDDDDMPTQATSQQIGSKEYLVLVPSNHDASALPAGLATHTVNAMPDLSKFFSDGGTIDVVVTGKAKHNVIITEIMIAKDLGKRGVGTPEASQWIEIYNNTDAHINISDIKVTFDDTGFPAPALPTHSTDRLSNVVSGAGWGLVAAFPGAVSGQTATNDDDVKTVTKMFKSLRRVYKDGKALQDLTAADQILDGWLSGSWTQTADSRVYLAGYVGTPGAENRPTVFNPAVYVAPDMSVTFNEIANLSDDTNEWIELKGPADTNMRKYKIEIVTGYNKDTNEGTVDTIFQFPDNDDIKIPSTGILLLTDKSPVENKLEADLEDGVEKPVRYRIKELKALPNDKDFLLVLRNKDGKILDVAGYLDGLDDNDPYTLMWPLAANVGAAKPGRISALNKLASGNVYKRARAIQGYLANKDDGKEPAFEGAGFTGIGYDRNVSPGNKEHHGTPGYENGIQIGAGAEATDNVVISEVMYGDGTHSLPQWIEIQNRSTTKGVDLHNWKLYVVNHSMNADGSAFTGKVVDGIFLRGVKIPPRQTALVVSKAGQNRTQLPPHRVLNLKRKGNDALLSSKGFYLYLVANAHEGDLAKRQAGDAAGNLPTPKETVTGDNIKLFNDAISTLRAFQGMDPAWELPAGVNDNNYRVSIARRGSDKILNSDGTAKFHWVSSADDKRSYNLGTSYGRLTDIGSPGNTPGAALPVSLSKFRPERMKDTGEIVVRWVTESELNNAGFNILRSEKRDTDFTKVHFEAGEGTTSERTVYEWKDTSAKPNVVYYYQIQDVSLDGEVTTLRTTHLRGNVTAAGKATTTWGEIKALQ